MLAMTAAITLFLIADGRVVLRDRSADPVPGVTAVEAAGVRTGSGQGAKLIPWNQVLRVEGEHAAEAATWVEQGDQLWRGLARLDRGDLPSAETLLEGLKGEIATARGPTAAAIWRGMLRCRLERGAQTAAAAAWLSWLSVGGSLYQTTGSEAAEGGSVAADETGLVPAIPPIWVDVPSVAVVAAGRTSPWQVDAARSVDVVEQLRAWYMLAAKGASGTLQPGSAEDGGWPAVGDEKSVQIVSSVVLAQYGDAAQRLAARGRLKSIADERRNTWLEVWSRVAIGRSLTRETDPEIRRLGVVELLHVPARLESVVPYLTGVAVAEAAATLRDLGDLAGATKLRNELLRRFGGHPAVEWSSVRDWPATPASISTPQVPVLPDSEEQH